jgi:hypothetical protein
MTTFALKPRRHVFVPVPSLTSPQPENTQQPGAPPAALARGVSLPPPAPAAEPEIKPPQCVYTSSDGRRCRMSSTADNPELCAHHAARLRAELEKSAAAPQALAAEILGPLRDFRTQAAINHALGRVFTLFADGRLDARKAAVLAYLCQLMQQGVKDVKREAWGVSAPPDLQQVLKAVGKAPPSVLLSPREAKDPS